MIKNGWYKFWSNIAKTTEIVMELIEIIRTSLIIFTIISTIFIFISYIVYKYKDKNRIKPYNDLDFDPPVASPKPKEIISVNKQAKVQSIHTRFHILNENHSIQPQHAGDVKTFSKVRHQPVISYYSFSKKERMHKLSSVNMADGEA